MKNEDVTKVSISLTGENLRIETLSGTIPSQLVSFMKTHKKEMVAAFKGQDLVAYKLGVIWGEISGSVPDESSNFLEHGGRSVDMMALKQKIHDQFSVDIPVSKLFKNVVFADQLKLICAKSTNESGYISGAQTGNQSVAENRRFLAQLVDDYKVLGADVSIYDGHSIESHSLGLESPDALTKKTSQQRYRVSCLSKVLLTYASLRLVDRGVFKLDVPLKDWVKGFELCDSKLKLKHLLNHSAGFDETHLKSVVSSVSDLDGFVQQTLDFQYMFSPGEDYGYSSSSIIIVAWLMQQVENVSWREVVNQEVFLPLGILDSGQGSLANSYVRRIAANGDFIEKLPIEEHVILGPAASIDICLSAEDLIKLAAVPINRGQTLGSEPYLSPTSAKQLVRLHTVVEGNYFISGWALGWLAFPMSGMYGFITGSGGQHTCVVIDINHSMALVMQTNTHPNFEFFDKVVKKFCSVSILKPLGAKPEFGLSESVGEYQAEGLRVNIYSADGNFFVQAVTLNEDREWGKPIVSKLAESGMGDYLAVPANAPLDDSINFHDLTGAGRITHVRVSQRLLKKSS